MKSKETDPHPTSGFEENLKKALTEFLILFLFGEKEHYIGELSPLLEARSHGTLSIVFPYAAVLRHHPGGPGPSAGDAGHLSPVFPGCQ